MTLTRECPPADVLLDLLDDELGPEHAEGVRVHIDSCETCRAVVARVLASAEPQRPALELHGTVVGGRYRVEDKLGAGAMAVVYAAWDERLERRVALKALATGTRTRARRLAARLLRESRAMARLRHPNVVTVHDVVHDDGRLFIAMELVQGQTLRQWLGSASRSPDEVLAALRQAGQGLAAAHSVGLVHRDFKPDNVLVDDDGRVLVTDFGLARSAHDDSQTESVSDEAPVEIDPALTETGAVVGTPAYMAPEQWRGDRVDQRCDVFAFCVTAFEALHGRRPFVGDTGEDLQVAKLMRSLAAPWSRAVPGRIRRAIEAGLDPVVAARPASMNALLARLQPSRSRALPIALGVGVLALGGIALASGDDAPAPASCAVDPLLDAFASSGATWLQSTAWDRAFPRLTSHVAAWRAAWEQTCVDSPTDEDARLALELRRSCLDAQGRRIAATLRLLQSERVDPVAAVRSLAPVRACEGELLGALRPVPDDPRLRAEVEAVRAEIAEAQAEQTAGMLQEVEPRAADLVARARELGYAPLLADALYLQGTNASMLSDHERARDVLLEAAEAAAAGGHDAAAAEIWLFLTLVVSFDLGDLERGSEYAALARATIERLGDAPIAAEMRIRWELHFGQLQMLKQDYGAALAAYERGYALAQEHDPSQLEELREGIAMVYQSTDRVDDAIALHRLVLAARLEELGDSHPRLVYSYLNLSGALQIAGRDDEALEHATAGVELSQRFGDPERDEVLRGRINRMEILRTLHRPEEALAEVDDVREILTRTGAATVLMPYLEATAALVLSDLERDAESLEAARRGLAIAEASMPEVEITSFLRICLADNLALAGEFDEALALARHAVETQRAAESADPIYVAMAEATLGNVLLEAGRFDEAVVQLQLAVERYDRLEADRGVGPSASSHLARALWGAGRREQSRELARRVYPELEGRERRDFEGWARERGVLL